MGNNRNSLNDSCWFYALWNTMEMTKRSLLLDNGRSGIGTLYITYNLDTIY